MPLEVATIHEQFASILMFLLFGAGFVVLNMVAIGRLIRAKTKYTGGKSATYECGEPTFGSAFVRFDIRFYVLALVFVIFDVEVLFLFPWAVVLKQVGFFGLVEAGVFVGILALGLAYVWRKGDINWIPLHAHQAGTDHATDRRDRTAAPPLIDVAEEAGTPLASGAGVS